MEIEKRELYLLSLRFSSSLFCSCNNLTFFLSFFAIRIMTVVIIAISITTLIIVFTVNTQLG